MDYLTSDTGNATDISSTPLVRENPSY